MANRGKVISLMMNKGGVGKTSSALAISQILALAGYRILFIDLDCQRNATRVLDAEFKTDNVDHNLLLIDEIDKSQLELMIKSTNFAGISIIPGTGMLYNTDYNIAVTIAEYGEKEVYICLKNNLDKLREDYDYIIIDTSPSPGCTCKSVIAASDYIYSPIDTSQFSMDALDAERDIINLVNRICETNAVYKGAFLNIATLSTSMTKFYREFLTNEKSMEDFYIDCPIRQCQKQKEANGGCISPLFTYAPKCTTAVDYVKLVFNMGLVDDKHCKIFFKNYKSKAMEEDLKEGMKKA